MKCWIRHLSALALFVVVAGCATTPKDTQPVEDMSTATAIPTETAPTPPPTEPQNPLLQSWSGPHGGVPPFDQVKVADIKPALERAMAESLAEVDRIANDPAPPTFQNTIAAMERAGRTLDRVGTIYGVWSSNMSTDEFQVVEQEMAPKLAAFSDQITQNEALFRRIEAVYNSPDKARLTPEQQRLVWLTYTNFVRAGAKLDPAPKTRLSEINQKLAELYTKFSQNLLEGKQSGAWMNAYRNQQRFEDDITTIVSNNSNFVKGKPGEPILISWDDAETLFHEFGHALHGLSSNVNYPTLSGTNVFRDYVEFPSQLLEHWLSTPEVLQRFAVNAEGQPIPQKLVDRIEKASTFNQGFTTTEYLASALVDMKLHLAGDRRIDPDQFEKDTLAELGMPREIVMRHRTPQFGHVFSGDGYSAGYYSYLWSDVLTADAYGAFTEGSGPYDKGVAARLRQNIFSVGNTVDPAEGYRAFRGRDPEIEALMAKRGFPTKASSGGVTRARKTKQ